MYFQIENTPEHVRRARRIQKVPKESPKEECPRLILAPFSRPPQVVFDNVLIGSTCERTLELFNPLKHVQQITLGKALPPGLLIQLPGEWLELEPETCYVVNLVWSPTQPTAIRETIRFTDESRGRYDVIVVLKSIMNIKGKGQQKGFKVSPGKIKKKVGKKSPVGIYKKKSEIIYNTTQIKKTINVIQSQQKVTHILDKENSNLNDYSMYSRPNKCPFDSPDSTEFKFDTSEVFANMRKHEVLQDTYDKSYASSKSCMPQNILKPSNRQTQDFLSAELFDNLAFTPLKSAAAKTDKLNKGPQIIFSVNSESDFDDSLDMKNSNKENQTHSIISITSAQPPNRWHTQQIENHFETPTIPNKKHPNTSSPKEMNSPNFTINTEFSRISDLSFLPQRVSTERKALPKFNNDTHEIFDDLMKLSSDTYTKDSPNTPMEINVNHMQDMRPPHFFLREQPKMCRQALFREYQQKEAYERNPWNFNSYEHNVWQNDLRADIRSPPRSITPPLQSIPEESAQISDTQVFDRTDKQTTTFTINRTFDKSNVSTNNLQSWSKKAVRAEPDLWKIPITHIKKALKSKQVKRKDSLAGKNNNSTFDGNKSVNQNISVNQVGNVYSQSFTVDPFLSSTYFYDEEAVCKMETEFKRWLNCILTPPADLDSNVEQKIDVGKAWIENRNKEIPAAPTREQVSSVYHNSHRLESLRRSARTLLMSPEIAQAIQKLNVQIEKKLIAIRADRNLHLDVGLQKIIMELLLSYNPLWLRIGLEAIYGLVLPLKSNSDIEGLTTFIIHRMFKNPFLKNKHSKSSAPNMLLPAYMEAIKKFTLKKFFMLVLFLDQAKQRKLISHDPCLFCRNAICKESKAVIIAFTRELIAGIGDITKHLRPLGYVVSHKQSYLDEYKYAVHNIASDIRDGVRLTKVMEIILMKDGLLNQLRTPPISRLQKRHNVQVALQALNDANFAIVGDITATDIADGHREKTLSLLWQIIHVFRAPLFEKAANVIQIWWKKKYEVIVEKRREAERVLQEQNYAASVIQTWWRRIQYNRYMEAKMLQITSATIVLQKYCRMWLYRTRLVKSKKSVLIIEQWYRSVKMMRQAKSILERWRLERAELRYKSATIIQSYVRRWLCMKHYQYQKKKIVLIQASIRRFLAKNKYEHFKKAVIYIQRKYKDKLQMRMEIMKFHKKRTSAILIQSYYRMTIERRAFLQLKQAVKVIEDRYIALTKMRNERKLYRALKENVVKIQALYRLKKVRQEYLRKLNAIISLQRRVRAIQLMKKEKQEFSNIKNAVTVLQKYVKSYRTMKKVREEFIKQRQCAILIQRYFRAHLISVSQRQAYIRLRNAAIVLQNSYRNLLLMRKQRSVYLTVRKTVLHIQRQYRARNLMKKHRQDYLDLRNSTITIQRKFRAQIQMRVQRAWYLKLRSSCLVLQSAYRAFRIGKLQREEYIRTKAAAVSIQRWFRNCRKSKLIKQQYQQSKQACVTIQRIYRARIIGRKQRREFIRIRKATICIQKYYRSYIEMKILRQQYIRLKTATVTIQRTYRSHLETKKQRYSYLQMKAAALLIANHYKLYKETKMIRHRYCQIRESTIRIQEWYRSICAMRKEKENFNNAKKSIITIQQKYKAVLAMRKARQSYLSLKASAVVIQRRFRAILLMRRERTTYIRILQACSTIQTYYRAFIEAKTQRENYMNLKHFVTVLQRRYRALQAMRKYRDLYLQTLSAAINLQRRYRARCMMLTQRNQFLKLKAAAIKIQRSFRAYICGKQQKNEYNSFKSSVIIIQRRFRLIRETRKVFNEYQALRNAVILVQRRYRAIKIARAIRHNEAARKIQHWYMTIRKRDVRRREFLKLKESTIIIQSTFRMYVTRKRFVAIRKATLIIQRYYRSYKLATETRREYLKIQIYIVKLQSYFRTYIARRRYQRIRLAAVTIQAAYRFKRENDILKQRREAAVICLQKNVRRYLVQSKYLKFRQQVIFIQKLWKGKLYTRLLRCNFMQKRRFIIKLQSIIRGYLVRRDVRMKMINIQKAKEEMRRNWAASKIQALFRGHKARVNVAHDKRVTELRHRWRDGGLQSRQETLKERNEEAMEVLRNISGIETVIKAFRSLELLTEVSPMMYNHNASAIVHHVYTYMSVTNRSISSIEVLKSAAAVLVNLTRYKVTGPKIYSRDRIPPILKFMWRFSNSETQLFCIMATYLWLFSKYEHVRQDLTELLNLPENHRMLMTMKGNVDRTKRMVKTIMKNKFHTAQPSKFVSHTNNLSLNSSAVNTSCCSAVLPALEPDYGIVRIDKPRYFEDAPQAINCLFYTYNL